MIINYVPCKDKKEAEKIATYLVNKKLIACANIFPITSIYGWKGKTTKDSEYVLIAKTKKNVEEEIKKLHSYETQCILRMKVKANKEYERWVDENCC